MKTILKNMKMGLISSLTVLAMMSACQKDRLEQEKKKQAEEIAENVVNTGGSSNRVTNYHSVQDFLDANKPSIQTFNFSASETIFEFTGAKGSKGTISRSALQFQNGNAVTGDVSISFVEALRPIDMILLGKPTVSQGYLLQSGGEFFIKVTSGGQTLQIAPSYSYTVELPSSNVVNGMIVFEGEELPTGFDWNALYNDSTGGGGDNSVYELLNSYLLATDSLGWINCDRFYNSGLPLTTLIAKPCDQAFESFMMFAVFPSINSVMSMYPDVLNEQFVANNVPEGEAVVIVAIGIDALGQLYLSFEQVTVTTGQVTQLSCEAISEADLLAFLAGL